MLAHCFRLQEAFDELQLDRALGESPEASDGRRRGLKAARQNRLEQISQATRSLLARMDVAVGTANAKIVWNLTKSLAVIEAGNHVAARVHDFHEPLGIVSDHRFWKERQLGPAAAMGAQAIQQTRNTAPIAAAAGVSVGAASLRKKLRS
jgi:hypothetical protein